MSDDFIYTASYKRVDKMVNFLNILESLDIKSVVQLNEEVTNFLESWCGECEEHEDNCICHRDYGEDYDCDRAYDEYRDRMMEEAAEKAANDIEEK